MAMKRRFHRSRRGFTIVELLVSVVLGLLLIAVVSTMYVGNRQTSVTQRDLANVAQSGAYAIDVVSRLLRQAGHVSVDGLAVGTDVGGAPPGFCGGSSGAAVNPAVTPSVDGGFIEGKDAATPTGSVVADSDYVLLRFYGSSAQRAGSPADGSIVDCFGKAVAGPTVGGGTAGRTWARLYVQNDSTTGNPALFCTYLNAGSTTPTTQALVDNIESFQVLYGVGAKYDASGTTELTSSSGVQNYRVQVKKYLPASAMASASDWNNVIAVRIGLMVSGDAKNSRGQADTKTDYNLFGSGYSGANGASFDATSASSLSSDRRSRLRQVFSTTVELKNAPLYVGCDLG